MSDETPLSATHGKLKLYQAEIHRQRKEAYSRRSVAKVAKKRPKNSLVLYLDTYHVPRWTCCEFGAGTAAFSQAYLKVTKGRVGIVTIDNDPDACAQVEEDYTSFLGSGLGAAFAKRPPSVLLLCTNCTSNSKSRVMTHRRCDEPIDGVPTTLDAARTISFANASNEAI